MMNDIKFFLEDMEEKTSFVFESEYKSIEEFFDAPFIQDDTLYIKTKTDALMQLSKFKEDTLKFVYRDSETKWFSFVHRLDSFVSSLKEVNKATKNQEVKENLNKLHL
jgi:hypothetical protein